MLHDRLTLVGAGAGAISCALLLIVAFGPADFPFSADLGLTLGPVLALLSVTFIVESGRRLPVRPRFYRQALAVALIALALWLLLAIVSWWAFGDCIGRVC